MQEAKTNVHQNKFNPITFGALFNFQILERYFTRIFAKSCSSKNTHKDINMWNSRNRILIDTDGDDVAFLSGSGSQ